MKKTFIILLVVIAAVGVVFFSFFWPLNDNENLAGTIWGVQKSERFKGEQLSESDLEISDPELVKLTQSAEWQNAMKNEDFVNLILNEDFQRVMVAANELKFEIIVAIEFKVFVSNNDFSNMTEEQFQNSLQAWKNSPELKNRFAIFGLDHNVFKTGFTSQDFNVSKMITYKNQMQKAINAIGQQEIAMAFVINNTTLGNKILANKDISNLIVMLTNHAEKAIYFNTDANGLINANDFVKACMNSQIIEFMNSYEQMQSDATKYTVGQFNQDFNQLILNQDMSKFFSQDFSNLLMNQNTVNSVMFILSNPAFLNSFRMNSSDFNQFFRNQANLYGVD
ncbi:MAG: hypothetical protein PHR06_08350 [Candidatus Cloacimonetes bacterium]|nr:hypothetical protein [Candidatus Cloacimonadota bacterium]